jgi:phosphoribosyl-ATP pyrophosphohydrolase
VTDRPDPLGSSVPAPAPDIGAVLADVYQVLEQRKRDLPEDSYTAKLLMGPQDKLLKKIGEESSELIIAARDGDAKQIRYELGDLLYHMLVVMVREGVTLEDVAGELAERRRR